VLGELGGEAIRRVRTEGALFPGIQRRQIRRPSAGQPLDRLECQRMESRPVARQLKLIGGFAQEGVAEEVRGFGAQEEHLTSPQRVDL